MDNWYDKGEVHYIPSKGRYLISMPYGKFIMAEYIPKDKWESTEDKSAFWEEAKESHHRMYDGS